MATPAEQSLAQFLKSPTRFLFFTGKGGVGKTSLACASAIALADGGHRVLLVSTDPASNLDEVLGVRLTSAPTAISTVSRLAALNIDPAAAAAAYREKMVGPYRGKLPEAIVCGAWRNNSPALARWRFGRERAAEHVADIARISRPVCPELEFHDNAGRHADGERERKDLGPEPRHLMVNGITVLSHSASIMTSITPNPMLSGG